MNPFETYQKIVNSITTYDERKCSRIMLEHIGYENRITLEELTRSLFGAMTANNERKTRLILETLVSHYRLPVCATSGIAGRWLAANREEIESTARDLESRIPDIQERARALRSCVLPAVVREHDPAQQPNLF